MILNRDKTTSFRRARLAIGKADPREVGTQDIGGGEFAVAVHRGPYSRLGETYASLCGQWLASAGREPRSAPALEIYCNSPRQTAPQDLITEIYIPLEPVAELSEFLGGMLSRP